MEGRSSPEDQIFQKARTRAHTAGLFEGCRHIGSLPSEWDVWWSDTFDLHFFSRECREGHFDVCLSWHTLDISESTLRTKCINHQLKTG